MPGVKQFLHGQLLETPALPTTSLEGRTILITGANSGLGLEAAKHILRLDASHIVLACRSLSKAESAKAEILKSAPSASKSATSTQISCYALQMDDFSSIAAFAEKVSSSITRLDTVILNAGVDLKEFTLTPSGYETTLVVNVLGTFLLALLLLPKLRETASKYGVLPRIAIVGSAVHFWANTKSLTGIPTSESIFKTLSDEKWSVTQGNAPMKGEARYFLSKLLVMLCVVRLAQVISDGEKDGKPFVVVNNVAPGYCVTGLFRNDESMAVKMSLKAIGRPADVGARTLVYAGCEAGRESHGMYLSENKVKRMSGWCKGEEGVEMGRRVWGEVVAVAEGVKGGGGKF
jgi:retinol dehydrogenase-12